MRQFPASKVEITRVYLVDCARCGQVTMALGDATRRAKAEEIKAAHVKEHRDAQREVAYRVANGLPVPIDLALFAKLTDENDTDWEMP